MLVATLSITGCARFAETYTSLSDSLGLAPAWERELRNNSRPISGERITVPSVTVDNAVPEGELIEYFDNGNIRLKTIVQNRCFDEYIEVYYENGQLRTITPMKNCLANGLSKGYQGDGSLSTTIHYVDGNAHGIAASYAPDGSIIQEIDSHG